MNDLGGHGLAGVGLGCLGLGNSQTVEREGVIEKNIYMRPLKSWIARLEAWKLKRQLQKTRKTRRKEQLNIYDSTIQKTFSVVFQSSFARQQTARHLYG